MTTVPFAVSSLTVAGIQFSIKGHQQSTIEPANSSLASLGEYDLLSGIPLTFDALNFKGSFFVPRINTK